MKEETSRKFPPVVMFDMDGTLLDTERIYQYYWLKAATELGYALTKEDMLLFRSIGYAQGEALMKKLTGEEGAYAAIRKRRMELMEPEMKTLQIPLKPTVTEALKLLQSRGARLFVVTATIREKTEEYLKRAGIRDYFEDLISAKMVQKGKPAPDVYLFAAQKAGVKPEETFAVEDAPNGIRSAAAAGFRTIMVPDLSRPDEELSALIERCEDTLLLAAQYMLSDCQI